MGNFVLKLQQQNFGSEVYQNLAEPESALFRFLSMKQTKLLFPGACNHLNRQDIRKLFMQFKILIILCYYVNSCFLFEYDMR